MEVLEPRDEADVIEIVSAALANSAPLEVAGARSKQQLGRPVEAERLLSTSQLSGISMYEAEELVLTAGAGTPMREVVQRLDQQGQQLAFEPINYHRFYGGDRLDGTIGGAIAINASGSRRLTAGAARDHLLGFNAISGRAQTFKSGGRVIKNVTGYDLSKLLCGSYGTLGVMCEVTVKVMPKSESEVTLVVEGLDDDAALRLLTEASGLPLEVSCLAHLPRGMSIAEDGSINSNNSGDGTSLLRLEGPEVSVASRRHDLISHFKSCGGSLETLKPEASTALWRALGEGAPVAGSGPQDDALEDDAPVWRISTAPTEGAAVVAAIQAAGVPVTRWFYDWAGGLIWLAVDGSAANSGAYAIGIRAVLEKSGGHATLIRAPADVRAAVAVFHPQPAALAALSQRVKHSFDPEGVLNPGRMRANL